MSIKVILFGATGMVGEGVLHECLADEAVASVLVIGRRSCDTRHPKLREILHGDFFDYSGIREEMKGYDACFFCLGISSIGKNEKDYRRITYDLTMSAARTIAEINPESVFCYVSGLGTDSTEQGRVMWARVKGKTENDLMKLPFRKAFAFRPGYIRPIPGLRNTLLFTKLLAPFYPFMRLFFPVYVCTLEDLGRSMIHAATHGYSKNILECKDITLLARSIHSEEKQPR